MILFCDYFHLSVGWMWWWRRWRRRRWRGCWRGSEAPLCPRPPLLHRPHRRSLPLMKTRTSHQRSQRRWLWTDPWEACSPPPPPPPPPPLHHLSSSLSSADPLTSSAWREHKFIFLWSCSCSPADKPFPVLTHLLCPVCSPTVGAGGGRWSR